MADEESLWCDEKVRFLGLLVGWYEGGQGNSWPKGDRNRGGDVVFCMGGERGVFRDRIAVIHGLSERRIVEGKLEVRASSEPTISVNSS